MFLDIQKRSAVFLFFLGVAACSRPHGVVLVPSREGQSSFVFLQNEPSPDAQTRPDEEIVPPRALGQLALPSYPPAALAARLGHAVLVLRAVIGTDGRIASLEKSPRGTSTCGAFEKEFLSSIEEAAKQWIFQPAEWRRLEDGTDLNADGKIDFRRVVERRAIVVFYDVRFEFDVRNGRGQVRTLPPQDTSPPTERPR